MFWLAGISHNVDSGLRGGEEKLLPQLTYAKEEAASKTICPLLTFTEHSEDKPYEARKEKKEYLRSNHKEKFDTYS